MIIDNPPYRGRRQPPKEDPPKVTVRGGIGILPLFTLLFVALKLTGHITWSWWWVLSPTLIPLGIGLFLLILAGAISLYGALKA